MDSKTTYKQILNEEDAVLAEVLEKQQELRAAVNAKDWTQLMKVISVINLDMDTFNHLDEERMNLAVSMKGDDDEILDLIARVRGKLVRCRTENKALSDYINITRNFVQGIIDTALPNSRAKVYSRSGGFVQEQPHSVVLNTLL